jgi:hypothetical protein
VKQVLEKVMATVKPLYASIADGTYDVQQAPGGQITTRIEHGKTFNTSDTQVFVLSDEVALAAQRLAAEARAVIPLDLSGVKLPYPKVAIEFELSKELQALRLEQSKRLTDKVSAAGEHDIDVVGLHASEIGGGAVLLQLYWRYSSPHYVEVSPVALVMNAGPDFDWPHQKIEMRHPQDTSIAVPLAAVISPTWMSGLPKQDVPNLISAFKDDNILFRMVKEAVDELTTSLFAALMLINCKSGITITRVPAKVAPSGYGKRLKRKHSSPAFTVLSLSEIEAVSSTGVVSRRTDLAAHYVRGHFKVRKSGVYWWNAFIRGSGTPRQRRAYVVKE